MRWEKRRDKKGETYYSFVYYDKKLKKNVRLRREEVPASITTDRQADEFCRLREAEHESAKLRIQRKLAWQKKFYDFDKIMAVFEPEIKKRAVNSWETVLYYLKQYVLDFYLNHKQSNNLNNWHLHFDDFRSWLEKVEPSHRTKTGKLSYSTRNHIIGALNTFLEVMHRKRMVAELHKCPKFAGHLLAKRTVDDVLGDEEMDFIEKRLREIEPTGLAADFFVILNSTGLRIGEGLALSMADFFPDEITDEKLRRPLNLCGIESHGYITIESQLKHPGKPKDKNGRVSRKPLKGRKRIEPESGRTIPVISAKVFNILARRWNEQNELVAKRTHGENPLDYLLFDGLTKNNYARYLVSAYKGTKYRHKSPHCSRHTFSTNFAGMAGGNPLLCKLVLGHKDIETTMRYIHLYESINRKARTRELRKTPIKLVQE